MTPVLFAVIPVFNEEGNIPRLVGDLRRLRDATRPEFRTRLVVVNDGSSDATGQLLRREADDLELEVLEHGANRGPGAAFATAFEYLAERLRSEDWVATMEGDNTSRIETLLQMLTRRKEGYDVVLASPYAYGGGFVGTSWWRQTLSHAGNQLMMSALRLYGLRVLSSFFRLHSASTLRRLQEAFGPRIVESTGFEWAVEMLYKMVLFRVKLSEVETLVDWGKRVGASKMRTLRTMRGYVRVLARHRHWRRRVASAAAADAWRPDAAGARGR
jgi:glycosyltransferase involved in cell wall biosynthesis